MKKFAMLLVPIILMLAVTTTQALRRPPIVTKAVECDGPRMMLVHDYGTSPFSSQQINRLTGFNVAYIDKVTNGTHGTQMAVIWQNGIATRVWETIAEVNTMIETAPSCSCGLVKDLWDVNSTNGTNQWLDINPSQVKKWTEFQPEIVSMEVDGVFGNLAVFDNTTANIFSTRCPNIISVP